mmetsp:Transcript_6577/g.22659  ORF Transcript_6577/g.22659 Transcript_6577/m.22659 type:complete len:233 (-) Transcript_6577:102-800(-)
MLIDLVRNDEEAGVPACDPGERRELGLGVHRPRRVAGRAQDQNPRLLREGALEALGGEKEVVLEPGSHDDRVGPGQPGHFGIRDPVRGRDDDLIPRGTRRKDGLRDRLLGTVRDHDAVRRDEPRDAVLALQLCDDGLPEVRYAGVGRVLGPPLLDREAAGPRHPLRRREVRLPGSEADHVLPLPLHLGRQVANRYRGRGLQPVRCLPHLVYRRRRKSQEEFRPSSRRQGRDS